MFLLGPEDGGPGLGDEEADDEAGDAGGGGCLALVLPLVPALHPGDHQAPLTGVLPVQHREPPVTCEGHQAVAENAIVGQSDPGDLRINSFTSESLSIPSPSSLTPSLPHRLMFDVAEGAG